MTTNCIRAQCIGTAVMNFSFTLVYVFTRKAITLKSVQAGAGIGASNVIAQRISTTVILAHTALINVST